jgi:hypothetical protein
VFGIVHVYDLCIPDNGQVLLPRELGESSQGSSGGHKQVCRFDLSLECMWHTTFFVQQATFKPLTVQAVKHNREEIRII